MGEKLTAEQRQLRARIGAHASWAKTPDRAARTAAAREAWLARFEREVDPDGVLPAHERRQRAEHARKAFLLQMAAKSAKTRAAKKAARERDTTSRSDLEVVRTTSDGVSTVAAAAG